ncbi:serine/threonine protein kinase, partial [Streptomyces sp. ME02-6978a]|nr:serine/threonine protein kinase [Streptomyces sp. ME02-6978a]
RRPGPRDGRRTPPRTTGTGRRPANPRLLRQRLFVFVVVTLLVALGIAAAQGCQGPANGLREGGRTDVRHARVHGQPDRQPYAPAHETGAGRSAVAGRA